MTLPPEWPDRLPWIPWLPAYWGESARLFKHPPDLAVVHSGSVAAWVAEYLSNPVCRRPKGCPPGIRRWRGARLCRDGEWRRVAAAHLCWYEGRINKVLPGLHLPPQGYEGFVQQVSLRRQAWGAGGSRFLGRGAVNARAIHIELPGPADAHERPDVQREALRGLLLDLRDCLPSLKYLTAHQWIDKRKRDPGPAVDAGWFAGLGFEVYWRDCRRG